jgi:hypothetical protein
VPDLPLSAPFPVKGLDVSHAHGAQPAGTTPLARNVRVCEPGTLRLRGGSRPGTEKYVPGQLPSGKTAFQELNFVVIASADALPTGIDDPGTITVDDPSSDGPAASWGTGSLGFTDPYDGTPQNGATEGTRNPFDGNGNRSKRRRKGGGVQPNKNVVTGAAPPTDPEHHCFQGSLTIQITKPSPDTFGFNGQQLAFFGVKCAPYVAGNPLFTGIQTALVTVRGSTDSDGAAGTLLPDYIGYWLWNHVGHDAYGTIIADQVSIPGVGTCSGTGTCVGAPPPSVGGTGAGAVINAKAPGT